jgi:hypothetical protein
VGTPAIVPKARCANILTKVAEFGRIERAPGGCSPNAIEYTLPMSTKRYLIAESNLPTFKVETFYSVCASICDTGKYESQAARKLLCGY